MPTNDPPPQPPALDPTDIEATPLSLRNPDLAPGVLAAHQGRPVRVAADTGDLDNNYASNGHWDRDDIGPVSYVPPVEAHTDDGPDTAAAGQAPAQQGGPGPRPDLAKDHT